MLISFLIFTQLAVYAQDNLSPVPAPYQQSMARLYPTLHFREVNNDTLQLLDYSGNWDFDNDGHSDSLLFIGNGGAHLYYHPIIVLSGSHKTYSYPFLGLDLPLLANAKKIDTTANQATLFPQFAVHDFDGNSIPDIYLNYDVKWPAPPAKWRRMGLTSRHLVLSYKNKGLIVENYKPRQSLHNK